MDKRELVNESIDYILSHYKDAIFIEDIANSLYISKYYFCRIFKEVTGESVYAFIKRLKVEQSAIDIKLKKNEKLSDIGLDYGYSSSNYSTVFKNLFHVSPATFRELANSATIRNPFNDKIEQLKTFEDYQKLVQIKELPNYEIVFQRTLGNYSDIKENWSSFLNQNKELMNSETIMIERFYTDPSSTTYPNNLCDLCLNVTKSTVGTTTIFGGKFAVYPFKGYIQDIFRELQGLFSIWLSQSTVEMREQYGLNIYHEIDWITEYVELVFCIPVK